MQSSYCAKQTEIIVYDNVDVHIDEYHGKWTISGSGLVGYQARSSLTRSVGGPKMVIRLLLVLFIQTPENERLLIDLMTRTDDEVAIVLGMGTDACDNTESFSAYMMHKWSMDPAAFVSRMSEFTAKVNEDIADLNLRGTKPNYLAISVLAIYITKTSTLREISLAQTI